uniref:Uncharacterized protein n=1 Tax=Alexandrium monilatum TaxID=311494 RepID=A0A7S4Q7I4_9DINO
MEGDADTTPSAAPSDAGRSGRGGTLGGTMHAVVQRCARARLLVDSAADTWTEVGRGLVVYISFAKGAPAAGEESGRLLRQAAKSILGAPLSSSEHWKADHTDAESVVALCRRGEPQSILVVPQASLVAKLELGEKSLKYHHQCAKALQAKRAAASQIAPDQLFKTGEYEGKYSQYDGRGVPTHDAEGGELSKSALKKLEKIYAGHAKKYAKIFAVPAEDTPLAGSEVPAEASRCVASRQPVSL